MAKRKRKATKREEAEDVCEAPGEEQAPPDESAEAPAAGGDFLQSLGAGLRAAGQAAERLARTGVTAMELEKLRLELRIANARLGEAVLRCWNDAPDVGVLPTDPAVKEALKAAKDLRRRVRELEQKIAGLRQPQK